MASRCHCSRLRTIALLLGGLFAPVARADESPAPSGKFGVVVNEPAAFQGYTLVFPLLSTNTYLLDMEGRVVHTWRSKYHPGQEAYLLENGHLLRPAKVSDDEARFAGAGGGGRVQEFTWDGELVWDYKFHDEQKTQHHGITRLPNGNVLLIVWERKSVEDSIAAGVNPAAAANGEILVDAIYEVRPEGRAGGEVVWQWHVWDHLVQDHDPTKANYGKVAEHPELIDANFTRSVGFAGLFNSLMPQARKKPDDKADEQKTAKANDESLDRLKSLGYVGAGGGGKQFAGFLPDWTHCNSVAYNAELDQIMISSRTFSEIWIIDHGTTTAEAAGHTGGQRGRGGDLLYRWGNPSAYDSGKKRDQQLFYQHDAHWIPAGLPGAGHVLIFSNGGRPDGNYSSVEEIELPTDADGNYSRGSARAYGPSKPLWTYASAKKRDFFAAFMAGAQRLPNGNTLICTGFTGSVFEVTPAGQIVWNFVNPDKGAAPPKDGPNFGPPGAGRTAPPALGAVAAWIGGPHAGGALFRAYRYAPDHPGLAGRDLKPGKTLVDVIAGD